MRSLNRLLTISALALSTLPGRVDIPPPQKSHPAVATISAETRARFQPERTPQSLRETAEERPQHQRRRVGDGKEIVSGLFQEPGFQELGRTLFDNR